jgi:hypothetical protein
LATTNSRPAAAVGSTDVMADIAEFGTIAGTTATGGVATTFAAGSTYLSLTQRLVLHSQYWETPSITRRLFSLPAGVAHFPVGVGFSSSAFFAFLSFFFCFFKKM